MNWDTYLIAQALGVAGFSTLCNAAHTAWIWRDLPLALVLPTLGDGLLTRVEAVASRALITGAS